MQGGAKGPGLLETFIDKLQLFIKTFSPSFLAFCCFAVFFSDLGIFFILPCIDAYARVDLRTRTYDVPPQEVSVETPS